MASFQGCMLLLWLFNMFMNREVKCRVLQLWPDLQHKEQNMDGTIFENFFHTPV